MNLGDPGHKIVQVGPEHRCSQFEHHCLAFLQRNEMKATSNTGAKPRICEGQPETMDFS